MNGEELEIDLFGVIHLLKNSFMIFGSSYIIYFYRKYQMNVV